MIHFFKNIFLFFIGINFLFFPTQAFSAATLESLEKTPLPDLHVPVLQRKTLNNGIRVLLLKDTDVPVVRGYLYIRAGSAYDPFDKIGLATLTAGLLREGGVRGLDSGAFNEALAARGAEISVDVEKEFVLFSFKCLKEDFPQVMTWIITMLREPSFEAGKLELLRAKALEALRRQNDQPGQIASREFPKLIYGKESPWAQTPTATTLQSIRREDILDFFKKLYVPDQMVLALAGDFSERNTLDLLRQLTKDWNRSDRPPPVLSALHQSWEPGVYLIAKPADQTTVVLGHFGEKRFNPDKYALLLLNEILGGDVMTSRLGKQIRSTLGLAYGIYSRFGLETDYGIFSIYAQTKGTSTKKVVEESRKILEEIRKPGAIDEAEMNFYKQSLLTSLFGEYEPRYNFAKDEARFEFLGYPQNYLLLFKKNLEKVSLQDLHRVAQKYLRPEALKVLLVGDPQKIGNLPEAKLIDME